jgi:hypothetical protein
MVLGLCVFAVCVALLGIGLLLRGRPLARGCQAACLSAGRCPDPAGLACAAVEGRSDER